MIIQIGEPGGGIDWPAWVQAVGSVLAILVSGFFAIWVPLHVRKLDRREVAAAAMREAINVAALVAAQVKTLRKQDISAAAPMVEALVLAQSQNYANLSAKVHIDSLGGAAVAALTTINSLNVVVAEAIKKMCDTEKSHHITDEWFEFIELQANQSLDELRNLVIHECDGVWRAITPEWREEVLDEKRKSSLQTRLENSWRALRASAASRISPTQ